MLAGAKYILEMHLKQMDIIYIYIYIYRVCGLFTKNKQRNKWKFEETGDSRYIYQNDLGKVCFQNDKVYDNFEGLCRRIASDKVLHDKTFNTAENSRLDNNQWPS